MTREQAQQLEEGDYVMSPYTMPAYMAIRVAEVVRMGDGVVMIRLPMIAGQLSMSNGWAHAELFAVTPKGYIYNRTANRYEKWVGKRKDKHMDHALTLDDLKALWRVQQGAQELVEA